MAMHYGKSYYLNPGKNMKLFAFITFVFFGSVRFYAQILTGQIFDIKTKETIPYVNIGIPGKGVGTVSDNNGNFSFPMDDIYKDDFLKISMIGYKPITLKIQDLKAKYGST